MDYGYDQNTHSITEVLKQLGLLGVFDLSQLQGQVDDLLKRFGINKGGLAGLISDSRREFADLVSYVQTHAKVAGDALDAIMRSGEAAAVRIKKALGSATPKEVEWLDTYDQQVQSTFGAGGGWATADDAYEKQHRAHLREQAQERGEAGPDEITDPARRKWLEQRETHANESAAQQRAWLEQQETHANQPMTRTSEDYDENGRPQRQRAMGGPVERGVPYWVGERGPERFIPTQDGTILPTTAPDGGTPSLGAGGYSSLGGNSSGGGGGPLRVELTLHIPELARDLVTEIVLSPGVLRRVHRDLADAMR